MKVHLVHVLGAAAMLVACAGSSKETRTASNQPAGTTQQGSVEGTGTAAGSQGTVTAQGQSPTSSTQGSVSGSTTGTSGAATADNQGASGSSTMGNDRSGQTNTTTGSTTGNAGSSSSTTGSTYGTSGSTSPSSSSTYGQSGATSPSSGSTYGQSGTTGSSGSTYGQSGGTTGSSSTYGSAGSSTSDTGTSASRSGSMDTSSSSANLKWANGRVSKVDSDGKSITLDRASAAGGSITLTVDDQTQIVDRRGSTSSDLSSIKEGTQVRASFDPASNRAQRIEVMGKSGKKGMHKKGGDASSGSMKTNAPSANTAKNPPQDRTGAPQTNPDQK